MQYKVYYNGKEKGEAEVFAENGRLTVRCLCPFEEGRIYKLYVCLEKEDIPLGIMLKEGGSFVYKRGINDKIVGQNGENIRYFYIEKRIPGSEATPPLCFSAERFENCRWIDTPDHALQNCIAEGGIMSCDFENTTYIAAPLDSGGPFALAPFFCLVSVVAHKGRLLGIMKLDDKNIPVHLNKEGEKCP